MNNIIPNEINELIAVNDFAKAKEEIIKLLVDDKNNIEALKLLGLCNVNMGLFNEGKCDFETVVKYKFDDATSWFYLASCYDNLQDFRHAISAYKEVIKLRENYWDAYKKLGVVYIRIKEFASAVELAEIVLKSVNDDYEVYYMAGTALLAARDPQASIPYFVKALEVNPEHSQIYNNLGTAYLSMGRLKDSLECFVKSSKLDSSNGITYFNIASIFQMTKKFDEACVYFEKAYTLEPSENYLSAWAFTEYKAAKYLDAIKHYKSLILKNPQKVNYQYNLACCFKEIGEFDFSAEILEKIIEANPKSKLMLEKLAEIYEDSKKFRDAKAVYEKMIHFGFISDTMYYKYALVCARSGYVDTAETVLKKVIELNPKFAYARKDLGVIYLNRRLFDYARDEFEKAFELRPNDVNILFEYANFLHATGDYMAAKALYKKALDINDSSSKVLSLSALNHIALNELNEALAEIEKALKLSRSDSLVYKIAGQVNYLLKNYENAQFYLIKSCEIELNSENQNLLGLTYFERAEFEKANNIFLNLLEKNPTNTVLLLNSAKCYANLKNIDKAKEQLQKLLDIFPEMEEASELLEKISS